MKGKICSGLDCSGTFWSQSIFSGYLIIFFKFKDLNYFLFLYVNLLFNNFPKCFSISLKYYYYYYFILLIYFTNFLSLPHIFCFFLPVAFCQSSFRQRKASPCCKIFLSSFCRSSALAAKSKDPYQPGKSKDPSQHFRTP